MSRKGNPWDNAACESFIKTLKYEEVLRNEYRDLAEARASIPEFLEKVCNQKRLHSALGYLPPVEFEAQLKAKNMEAAARQRVASVFKASGIYRSNTEMNSRERHLSTAPGAHRRR